MDNPAYNKAERLRQVEALLMGCPNGLSVPEIARRLGVHRSTVNRYLPSLGSTVFQEGKRLKIDREAYLVNVRLNIHEAVGLHLAARLLATRTDRQNPHAAAALRKLSAALEKLAPQVSRHMLQSAGVMDDVARREDPAYLQALEKLTVGWAEGRKVEIWYRSDGGEIHHYLYSPCFIEPYAIGRTTYVFGLREPPGEVRTFKVERIARCELTREPYDLPEGFDPCDLLQDAWGIWYTDQEPVRVALRFSPGAARRVKETCWHRSEKVEDLPDGGVLWSAKIAEPKEMMPWIRGWGADCEVVKPETLREEIKREIRNMAKIYE